jgi:hypothetical protein
LRFAWDINLSRAERDRIILEKVSVQNEFLQNAGDTAQGMYNALVKSSPQLVALIPKTVLYNTRYIFWAVAATVRPRQLAQIGGAGATALANGAPQLLLNAISTLSAAELAAKGGEYVTAARQVGGAEQMLGAVRTLSLPALAAKSCQFVMAAKQVGGAEQVLGAVRALSFAGTGCQGRRIFDGS